MPDVFSRKKRSQVMAAIRSRGNKDTELKLAVILRAHGVKGWRRNQRVPGHPDFVFRRERVAVFVDGCFWHGCPRHGHLPHTNQDYWRPKIMRNAARDRCTNRLLRKAGWRVLRIWAHSLRMSDVVVRRITSQLEAAAKQHITISGPIQRLAGGRR
jgi:DNA mismatch endonuclease, patch repair protein